jgi:uncharacterized membrane protein YoaK (UPF0700 family)
VTNFGDGAHPGQGAASNSQSPPQAAAATRRVAALSIGLAFVAGWADTVGFVALFGLFTAHVTGNFVLIGSELARASGSVLLKLLAFPAFIVAVAATRVVVLRLEARRRPVLPVLLALECLLLVAFMAAGRAAAPILDAAAPLAMAAGLLGAAAMGVQNAAGRLVLTSLVPTTVMTGNVTQLVIDAVDLARGAGDAAVRARARRFVAPIVAFAIGAIGGAFAYVHAGFASLLAPLAVLATLAAREMPRAASAGGRPIPDEARG